MPSPSPQSLIHHFALLEDPRVTGRSQHKLIDILVIAICGVICGADDWVAIAGFGEAKEDWFREFLEQLVIIHLGQQGLEVKGFHIFILFVIRI